jgi:hypothetical protein
MSSARHGGEAARRRVAVLPGAHAGSRHGPWLPGGLVAALAVVLVLLCAPGRHAAALESAPGAVWINEINTGAPDWIELANHGALPVDLSGWRIRFVSKGLGPYQYEDPPFVFPLGTTIPPGGYLILAEETLGFPCACLGGATITWTRTEGLACVLEDAAGSVVDQVLIAGGNGFPALDGGQSGGHETIPVRGPTDVIRRITSETAQYGSRWASGGNPSPCALNPEQTRPPLDSALQLRIPADTFTPGSICWIAATLQHKGPPLDPRPLVVLLDLAEGFFYCYPSWSPYPPDLDWEPIPVPPGETSLWIVAPFIWPPGGGPSGRAVLFGALLSPDLSRLESNIATVEFEFGP